MESLVDVTYDAPDVSMKVIDGAAFVNMNRPKSSTTYGKYCEDELLSKLKFTSQNTKRLDLVFDVYTENSQTRENRGGGKIPQFVNISVKIPRFVKIFKSS